MEKMLDEVSDETVRISVQEAHDLGVRVLLSIGYTDNEAKIIADHLVDNSMSGYAFAGLPRILAIADSPELQKPRQDVTIIRETPVSALLDGGNHVGYISVFRAAEVTIEKVKQSGIAIVGVSNSWFSGRNAYYLEKIARAGYVGIHTVSGSPMVAPQGASRPALGTNPIAIALPGKENPFIFDMGTGATMWGEVLLKAFLDEDFEEVVGIDQDGNPTKTAKKIVDGGIVPFAGHKGHGLSIAIQALGLLAGSKLRKGDVFDFGFLFIAFDPGLMMPAEQFTSELAELLTKLKGLPKQPGVSEIRIPSERSFKEKAIRREQGIVIKKLVYQRLQEMAARHG